MLIKMRPYQEEAIDKLRARIAEGIRKLILVMATGGGKTAVSAAIIWYALQKANRSLFIAHRRELIKQCFCKLVRNGIPPHEVGIVMAGVPSSTSCALFSALDPQLSDDDLWKMFARTRPNAPVQVASIDTLRSRSKPRADLVIVDECHRSVSKTTMGVLAEYLDSVILGLTATPYRADGRGLGELYQHLEVIATPASLMRDGYLVEPQIWTVPTERMPDLSKVRMRNGDYDEDELAEAMDRSALIGDIVDHWERRSGGARTVIFAAGVEHSKHIVGRFCERGIPAEHLDGTMPTDIREGILHRIDTGETRVISSVSVLTEGWDQPSVKCAVLARPTKSEGLHLQCLDAETEILTRRGFMGPDDLREDDLVAAMHPHSSEVTWEPIIRMVDRRLDLDEDMYEIRGAGMDVRVTDGHRMLYKCKTMSADKVQFWPEGWRTELAVIVARQKASFRVPVAGLELKPGLDLTDDELRFIGWFLTDGTKHHKHEQIAFSQAVHQPQAKDLEACIRGCGFKYGKTIRTPRCSFKNFSDQYHFTVSKGKPRGRDKHLTGWGRLDKYIDKDFSPHLEGIDERQLEVLLEAIHLGDGQKQRHAAAEGWTPQTYHIISVRKTFVDRLQSLCIRRGWRCNFGWYDPDPTNGLAKKRQYILHIKKQDYRSVGGAEETHRARLLRSKVTPYERVWCVENRIGTIFIRRNGKTAVVGNCVGRILRPFNGQEAIILDHAGNVLIHGRPQDDREYSLEPKKKRSKSSSAPSCKTCECLAVIPSATRICPMCGHQFSAAASERSAPEEVAGELVQIPRSISAGSDQRAQWDALVERWHRENRTRNCPRQPGWIWHEFKQKTGASRIPDGCALPALTDEQRAKLERFGELNKHAHAAGWSKARLHAVFNAQEKSS